MNRPATLWITAVTLCLATAPAQGETKLTLSGQVRVRHEVDHKKLQPPAGTSEFALLRTRVMLEAVVDSNTHAVVQFQDSRQLGESPSTSGGLKDIPNVDLHQAYVQIDRL